MKDCSVLMTAAPRVKYDLTMHYRYADFGEVIGFLRELPDVDVSVLDGAVMNHLIRDYVSEFLKGYDLVVFFAETAESKMTQELATICKRISPNTKIAVYGDATLYIPQFFTRYPFDAVHVSGDQDIVLADYIRHIQGCDVSLHGLQVNTKNGWKESEEGKLLDPDKWSFPALDLLPLNEYRAFCQVKGVKTFDGSVYVAKGCRFGCAYCVLPRREGAEDRRRPIEPLVDYLSLNKDVFDDYQLHAGTFTEDHNWVIRFCESLSGLSHQIRWKCTTRVDRLDEVLLNAMGEAGCRGVNIGVESLSINGVRLSNKTDLAKLEELSGWLQSCGIHSKAYIMVGMPRQTINDVTYTIDVLQGLGYAVRPTGYTPFQKLSALSVQEIDEINLDEWDRKSFFSEDAGMSYREFHELLLLSKIARDAQAEVILERGQDSGSLKVGDVVEADL